MINDHDFFKISKKYNDILDNNNTDIFQSISKLHVIKHHSAYFSKFKSKFFRTLNETSQTCSICKKNCPMYPFNCRSMRYLCMFKWFESNCQTPTQPNLT